MGWTGISGMTKDEHAAEVLRGLDVQCRTWGRGSDSDTLYAVIRCFDRENVLRSLALVVLFEGGGREWASKMMDETVGPRPAGFPVEWLAMLDAPKGYAAAWRARVRNGGTERNSGISR